jgi:glutamate 5-kinase
MRNALLENVRRVVIKIGSAVLVDAQTGLQESVIAALSRQCAELRRAGREIVLVSSGAVACGRTTLERTPNGASGGRSSIPYKQAAAAVGQPLLMQTYEKYFSAHGFHTAQVLLTYDDVKNRQRFLNARNTLLALLELSTIPIINENDTVLVDEIKFGDNDQLSALTTNVVDADLLVLLSDIEGLYDADPKTNPNAKLLPLVESVDSETFALAAATKSAFGSGGMASKLGAARTASRFGIPTILAAGRRENVLCDICAGAEVGTLFLPSASALKSRKHWIAFTLQPAGRLIVDAGAAQALMRKGRSLLPSGVLRVEGIFEAGDSVSCADESLREIARGLVAYSSADIEKIRGAKTDEIERRLGFKSFDEVIHRDDLVILDE